MRSPATSARSDDFAPGVIAPPGRAQSSSLARPALATRFGVSIAAAALLALLAYGLLQLTGAGGGPRSPGGTIPLFWRLRIAAATSAYAAPGLWRLGGMDPGSRARILRVLLLGAAGAIIVCAVVAP